MSFRISKISAFLERKEVLYIQAAAVFGLGLILANAVSAADYTSQELAVAPKSFDWSGAYVGLDTAGVHGGFNQQSGTFVYGAEIEGQLLDTRQKVSGGHVKAKGSMAAKVKAGMAIDRALVYGVAGVTATKYEGVKNVADPKDWAAGYVVGGGVEYAVTDNVSLKAEYNYRATGDVKTKFNRVESKKSFGEHQIGAGVNFRF